MKIKYKEIITKKLIDIYPYRKNVKAHPEYQIDNIAKSIEKFGFNQPIVVDEKGEIIVGHGRYFASLKLELDDVPVIVLDNLTPSELKAYRIADNKLNESEWILEMLKDEMENINETDREFVFLDDDTLEKIKEPELTELSQNEGADNSFKVSLTFKEKSELENCIEAIRPILDTYEVSVFISGEGKMN